MNVASPVRRMYHQCSVRMDATGPAMKRTFAEALKYERWVSGLTQDTLAERVGVTRQQVHRWEQGTSSPKLNHAIRTAAVFKAIRLDDLKPDDQPEMEL